jgi:hypothetical protein
MSERPSRKAVAIPHKPTAEQWVSQGKERPPMPVRLKRLTLDIPEALHKALKRLALEEDTTMLELAQSALEDLIQRRTRDAPPS